MTHAGTNETREVWRQKVYLICRMDHLVPVGEPNLQIIDVKLTRTAADTIVEGMPGTFVKMFRADKLPSITPPLKPRR